MSIAKVTLDGISQLDLTGVTINSNNLLPGVTAHNAAGEAITGAAEPSLEDAIITRTISGIYENNEVTQVRPYIFYDTYLTSIKLPNVTTIYQYAFKNCSSLTSVEIGNSNISTSLYGSAFQNCSSLENIKFNGKVVLNNYAFYNCSSLISYKSVGDTDIDNYAGSQFQNCTSLAGIVLIGLASWRFMGNGSTFKGCSSLKYADLTKKIVQSGPLVGATFKNCSILDTLILRYNAVPELFDLTSFQGTPFEQNGTGGTLYVPSAYINDYKAATNWSTLLSYTNNQILAIEGSQYQNYYADGTPISV